MSTRRLTLFVCLALLLVKAKGQVDFDLSDALDTDDDKPSTTALPPKKPDTNDDKPSLTPKPPKKPDTNDNDLDLSDALGGEDPFTKAPPVVKPNPGGSGSSGNLDDSLFNIAEGGDGYKPDENKGGGGGGGGGDSSDTNPGSNEEDWLVVLAYLYNLYSKFSGQSSGSIAGIVGAVGMALLGAASSYFAYQKKKLCFRGSGNQESVNMEAQNKAHLEPQSYNSLLEK
ncbi:CD99 molecule isoform X2 [Latimeria chalumnae]|uniref:CD99 molecule isoform X2 n=1 Tax=Latimeria chalumnae TaxID=7897 RepID=UPI00313D6189